jgi:NAD+ synthase (glutamine-hydrolysing)
MAKTMDRLELPRSNILAFTLPGFGTSEATLGNARRLMRSFAVTAQEIDIRPACERMFREIDHPFAAGEPVYDTTFENVQAGQRTSLLFRLANRHEALVVGTSDLSELALGWMTYGVGDHMSHYAVNISVPKTLIQHLIRWVAASGEFDEPTSGTLREILGTEISPELVPGSPGNPGGPSQRTADVIGPYDLQDFFLYHIARYGLRPSKVAFLALKAWADSGQGRWPDLIPSEKRAAYDLPTIKRWLEVFLIRFFKLSQFKRSVLPNGPKIGSGGSLSPRSDWRAPSDADAEVWLRELAENVPPGPGWDSPPKPP